MNKVKRNYNLDLLRILACFMVIVIHVSANKWYSTNSNSFDFNVYNFYDSLVRAAVPLFLMISGVFFLSKKEIDTKQLYRKNILKLLIVYCFWNTVYYFYVILYFDQTFNILTYINKLVLGHYHLWFIPMIIGLYVIAPLLTKITINSDKKLFKYFIVVFIFGCLMKTIDGCTFLPFYELIHNLVSILPVQIICQYYSYFLLGYFLYNYEFPLEKYKTKWLVIIVLICTLCCSIGTWYLSYRNGINTDILYDEFSIFTLCEAIAIFLIFKQTKFISESIYYEEVSKLSKNTLGIYVIHVLVMNILFNYNIVNVTDFNPILSIPLISIIVFIISFVLVYFIGKISFVKKWII